MLKDIYDPLTEYVNVFRGRFKKVSESTFDELAAEAKVDIDANRETCGQLYATEEILSSVKSRIGWWTAGCVILWIGVIAGVLVLAMNHEALEVSVLVVIGISVVLSLICLLAKVHPRLKELRKESSQLAGTAEQLRTEAWKQMSSLNRLYDWDILTRMMSRTIPKLEFDPYFTTQRLADLKSTYGWDDSFNEDRSVLYSHSGLINGNPFVICRTRKMEMGRKTYYGSRTIYWTTRERGSDGKYHSVRHSQVLTATVTAPYPEYFEKTRLIYGNTAAPDLTFYRKHNGLAGREDSLSFKWNRHKLRKKARNLDSADFAMLTNEEFEVAFNTSNRNNNQQFALLFTPLAQESMLNLLRDEHVGYGDDFDFEKERMINTIIPAHLQTLDLDMNPAQYRNFDYDKAKADFYTVNAAYFRAIYFSMAPLLCVPMYQQIRSHEDIYGHNMKCHSAYWEHEALANFWGQEHFKHPDCVTECILKTESQMENNESSIVTVYAYGYRSVKRLSYVRVFGGDGRFHRVPVYWDEYLPVTGHGQIEMVEDNDFKDVSLSHQQRMEHINKVLSDSQLKVYRRHIASKI